MATSQQQSAPGDFHRLALTSPEASISNSRFDVPILGGAGLSGQPHERMDLSGCYPPWQSAASMALGFDFGLTQLDAGPRVPTSNHSLNTFGASLLFDPMGYTGPVDITDLVQQEYLSSAFGSNQRIVPPFGTEAVAGGNRISVHPLANHEAPAIVQSPRQAYRQAELNAHMDPPEVSIQTGHDQSANDGIRISLTSNQMQSSVPGSAPIVDVGLYLPANGDDVLNRGEDNGNFDMPSWIALTKPLPQAEDRVITLRRDTHVALDLNFEEISMQLSEVCSGIKIPATGSVKNYADTTGKFLLEFRINLYGATTKRRYKNVCANCEKREGKKKGILSPIDFKTESDMIAPKDGKIRIVFVFCCYPKDHRLGDGEYLVEVVLSKDADQNRIVARHQLPFSFKVVPKYSQAQARPPPTAGAKRSRRQIEESEEIPPTLDRRNVRPRSEGPSQRVAGNDRIDDATPAINLRDAPLCGLHRDGGPSGSLSLTPPPQLLSNAGPNSDLLNTPHQAIILPRTDRRPTPTLVDVNPESGSITGGARIWLKGKDFPAVFPLFARFGTAVVSTTFSSSTLLSCHLPPATLPGLVDVTLSKDHQSDALEYGTSIAKFQYLRDQDQLLPILLRIQGQACPEFAPVLQAFFTALSGSQGNQILQGRSGVQPQENPIETGLVHALGCIQARPNFREIVSTTNEYGQTLAHLAILYDYPSLLHHLVDWRIDLAISDVNGLTALHCAYMKGDLHSVQILRRGDAPEAAKDKLGRIPSDLQPEGFGGGFDTDVEMHSPGNDIDEQVALGFGALALEEDNTSEHGQSESEEDASDAKEPASISVDSFAGGNEGGGESGRYQVAPGFKEPVIERFPRILPTVAARPSGREREKSPLLANRSMSHSCRHPSPKLHGMFSPRSSCNNPDDPLTVALLHQYQSPQTYAHGQMPTYQPQSTWSGYDYYNAHSGYGNRSEYDSLWLRSRRTFGTKGYSRSEAKRWFRIVYDHTDIHQLSKTHYRELGAAVGYQANRVWEHQHNTHRIPLSSDREREREQLAGLAIAEASKLWDRWNHHEHQSSRREKCIETAVATAEYIFDHQYEREGNRYENAFRDQDHDQGYHSSSGYTRTRPNSYNAYPEEYSHTPGYSRSRRNSTAYEKAPVHRSRSRRNSDAYASQPVTTSQPIPMQHGYQNINGYTVASSPPQVHYMGGAPPSPNALHMALSSSPGGQYPYVPPQPHMQPQPQYAFPTNQPFNGYTVAQQPMDFSSPEHGYMHQTPATPYGRRPRSMNFHGGNGY